MIPSGARVFLRSDAVDFRKGPEGLVSLVRDAGADPFNGSLYVFRAKRSDRIKIVWWDGSGLCLFAKRLERSHSAGRRRQVARCGSVMRSLWRWLKGWIGNGFARWKSGRRRAPDDATKRLINAGNAGLSSTNVLLSEA
jgi:transposase